MHNTATIDGKNTFHCLGGIKSVTPSSSVAFSSIIPHLKGALPKASTSSTSCFLSLTEFKNNKPFKLDTVIIRDWKETDRIYFSINIKPIDLLYFYGKHTAPKNTANWHGFMNTYNSYNTDYCTTIVIASYLLKHRQMSIPLFYLLWLMLGSEQIKIIKCTVLSRLICRSS